MDRDNVKEEMQCIIKKCIIDCQDDVLQQCLNVYEETFGKDEFYKGIVRENRRNRIQVSLICMDMSEEDINKFLDAQTYNNIEIVKMDKSDTYEELQEYFYTTNSSYVCFLENGYVYSPVKIEKMVYYICDNIENILRRRCAK